MNTLKCFVDGVHSHGCTYLNNTRAVLCRLVVNSRQLHIAWVHVCKPKSYMLNWKTCCKLYTEPAPTINLHTAVHNVPWSWCSLRSMGVVQLAWVLHFGELFLLLSLVHLPDVDNQLLVLLRDKVGHHLIATLPDQSLQNDASLEPEVATSVLTPTENARHLHGKEKIHRLKCAAANLS